MLKTVSSITNAIGALNYNGTWNASTNTPNLSALTAQKGDYYVVSVAGTTSLGGVSRWGVGDWAVYNGSVWQRVEGGSTGEFTTVVADSYATSNAAAGLTVSGRSVTATGTDTNIDLLLDPKGTGGVAVGASVALDRFDIATGVLRKGRTSNIAGIAVGATATIFTGATDSVYFVLVTRSNALSRMRFGIFIPGQSFIELAASAVPQMTLSVSGNSLQYTQLASAGDVQVTVIRMANA